MEWDGTLLVNMVCNVMNSNLLLLEEKGVQSLQPASPNIRFRNFTPLSENFTNRNDEKDAGCFVERDFGFEMKE